MNPLEDILRRARHDLDNGILYGGLRSVFDERPRTDQEDSFAYGMKIGPTDPMRSEEGEGYRVEYLPTDCRLYGTATAEKADALRFRYDWNDTGRKRHFIFPRIPEGATQAALYLPGYDRPVLIGGLI